jgi:hypothetical protein
MNRDMQGTLLESELWGSLSSENVKMRSTTESVTKPSPKQYGVFSKGFRARNSVLFETRERLKYTNNEGTETGKNKHKVNATLFLRVCSVLLQLTGSQFRLQPLLLSNPLLKITPALRYPPTLLTSIPSHFPSVKVGHFWKLVGAANR